MLTIDNWMVAWTPDYKARVARGAQEEAAAGSILVGLWPDRTGWSDPFAFTTGCCMVERRKFKLDQKIMMMFIDFHTIVVRDGVDPQVAHCEFLKIDEYRRRISRDIKGAVD